MKRMYLLLLAIVCVTSCKKDRVIVKEFYGTWELRSSISFEPQSPRSYPPGNGTYVELKNNDILNRYKNGKIESTEKCSVKERTANCNGSNYQKYWALEYDNGSHDAIKVNKDTLTIYTPPCMEDGGVSTYVRLRN